MKLQRILCVLSVLRANPTCWVQCKCLDIYGEHGIELYLELYHSGAARSTCMIKQTLDNFEANEDVLLWCEEEFVSSL